MKASAPKRIVLLSAASVTALSGCQEERADVLIFDDPESCAATELDSELRAEQYAEALAEHEETAPRYDALAVCAAEHGEGACIEDEQRPSIFLPLMAGYLMGQMMSGRGYASRAMVPAAGGGFATPDSRRVPPACRAAAPWAPRP